MVDSSRRDSMIAGAAHRRGLWCSCVVAVSLWADLAGAQPAQHQDAPKPWVVGISEAEQQVALAVFKEGNSEFEQARYAQALAKYRQAIKHWDHPAIRFNMVVCLV